MIERTISTATEAGTITAAGIKPVPESFVEGKGLSLILSDSAGPRGLCEQSTSRSALMQWRFERASEGAFHPAAD